MKAETQVCKVCKYESGPDESGEDVLCQGCWESECDKAWREEASPFWLAPLPEPDEMDRVAEFFDGLRK